MNHVREDRLTQVGAVLLAVAVAAGLALGFLVGAARDDGASFRSGDGAVAMLIVPESDKAFNWLIALLAWAPLTIGAFVCIGAGHVATALRAAYEAPSDDDV